MSVKNFNKPQKNSRYHQGYFKGAKKYFGPEPIIYRSSLEYIFMQKLEMNENVIKWSSENFAIPYVMKEPTKNGFKDKKHKYYIDFTVFLKNGERLIVEIKPAGLVPLNQAQIKRNPMMHKNACKWKAAIQWAKHNGYKFVIIDENRLKGKIF